MFVDHKAGDQICSSCGQVASERLIAQDAEYRVFSEDSASYGKIRVGAAYNPLKEYSLTEKSRMERDVSNFTILVKYILNEYNFHDNRSCLHSFILLDVIILYIKSITQFSSRKRNFYGMESKI